MDSTERDEKVIDLLKEIAIINEMIESRQSNIAFLTYEIDKLEVELQVQKDNLELLKEESQVETYKRLMDDDSIDIQLPEGDKGLAYFRIDGVKYSCHWEIDMGVDKNSIEVENK